MSDFVLGLAVGGAATGSAFRFILSQFLGIGGIKTPLRSYLKTAFASAVIMGASGLAYEQITTSPESQKTALAFPVPLQTRSYKLGLDA